MSTDEQPTVASAPGLATELLRAVREQDPLAAALLQEHFRAPLIRFCWGYLGRMDDAEDAVQEIAIKVLDAGALVPDHFRAWVYKVARNHCLNLLRARARRVDECQLTGASQVYQALTGNLTRLARDEMRAELAELVRSLPDAIQEVLRLRYAEELSRAEIAEVLELPESLVKNATV